MPVTSSAVSNPSSASSGGLPPCNHVLAPASPNPERNKGFSRPAKGSSSPERPKDCRKGIPIRGFSDGHSRKKPWLAMCRIQGDRQSLTARSNPPSAIRASTPNRAATCSPSPRVPPSRPKWLASIKRRQLIARQVEVRIRHHQWRFAHCVELVRKALQVASRTQITDLIFVNDETLLVQWQRLKGQSGQVTVRCKKESFAAV